MEKPKIKHLINTTLFFLISASISFFMLDILKSIPKEKSWYGLIAILIAVPLLTIFTFILFIIAFSKCNLNNPQFNRSFILNIIVILVFTLGTFLSVRGEEPSIALWILFFILSSILFLISIISFIRGYFLNRSKK